MGEQFEFVEFPKVSRLSRECIISEKIDGTNAQVFIRELADSEAMPTETPIVAVRGKHLIYAGSRTQWITPGKDNYGFAKWVKENADKIVQLGAGRHFGEWWGSGCQRGYGLAKGEKRWSLFNVSRWCLAGQAPQKIPNQDPRIEKYQEVLPEGFFLVPVLYRGLFTTNAVDDCVEMLRLNGSMASPGFMDAEGVVCFHTAANIGFKKTLKKDESPKSLSK